MATKTDSFIGLIRETYLIQAADLRDAGEEVDALWYESLVESLEEHTHLSNEDAIQASVELVAGERERSQFSLIHDREDEAVRTLEWVKNQWMARQ